MKGFSFRRPSASMIVAMLALVVALGGSASAGVPAHIAKLISGSSIKKHSISGNRLKNNTLTGTQIKESSLGKVKSAAQADNATEATHATSATSATSAANAANATNAANAANAAKLGGKDPSAFEPAGVNVPFTSLLNEDETAVVASSADFDVVAVCDANSSLAAFNNEGTALYIKQKGPDNGYAATSDDDDSDFDTGDIVGFDFQDEGDTGDAINTDGHYVHVDGGVVTAGGAAAGLGKDCAFNGVAVFG